MIHFLSYIRSESEKRTLHSLSVELLRWKLGYFNVSVNMNNGEFGLSGNI